MWRFILPNDTDWRSLPFDWVHALSSINARMLMLKYRGVSIDRVRAVLRNGIDVDPPDSIFYVNDFTKAWEYGGWPKLVLALDPTHLSPTYVEVDADTPEPDLRKWRDVYPTMLPSKDGTRLWLSRMREDDPRIGSPYEFAYARWIPGDVRKALRAMLIFSTSGDEVSIEHTLAAEVAP